VAFLLVQVRRKTIWRGQHLVRRPAHPLRGPAISPQGVSAVHVVEAGQAREDRDEEGHAQREDQIPAWRDEVQVAMRM